MDGGYRFYDRMNVCLKMQKDPASTTCRGWQMMKTGSSGVCAIPKLTGSLSRLADPVLQGLQLLGVFMAGLVVGDDGGGNGRERKSFGGRISISGG